PACKAGTSAANPTPRNDLPLGKSKSPGPREGRPPVRCPISGCSTALKGRNHFFGSLAARAGAFANESDSRGVSPVMAERSLELLQVAFFCRSRTSPMDSFTVDEPQLPASCRHALRENVSRGNTAPAEARIVDSVEDASNGLKNRVTVVSRKLRPGAAQY